MGSGLGHAAPALPPMMVGQLVQTIGPATAGSLIEPHHSVTGRRKTLVRSHAATDATAARRQPPATTASQLPTCVRPRDQHSANLMRKATNGGTGRLRRDPARPPPIDVWHGNGYTTRRTAPRGRDREGTTSVGACLPILDDLNIAAHRSWSRAPAKSLVDGASLRYLSHCVRAGRPTVKAIILGAATNILACTISATYCVNGRITCECN